LFATQIRERGCAGSACAFCLGKELCEAERDSSDVRGKAARKRAEQSQNRSCKRRGELAELAFALKAASLGFRVSKPYGDSDPYDFAVDCGSRIWKVQVKSSSHLHQGAYFISSQRCCHGVAIPYKESEIDFLAAYVCPEDAWFVIPARAFIPRTSLHLFPREREERGLFAKYKEAWCLMGCRREGSFEHLHVERKCGGTGVCRLRG